MLIFAAYQSIFLYFCAKLHLYSWIHIRIFCMSHKDIQSCVLWVNYFIKYLIPNIVKQALRCLRVCHRGGLLQVSYLSRLLKSCLPSSGLSSREIQNSIFVWLSGVNVGTVWRLHKETKQRLNWKMVILLHRCVCQDPKKIIRNISNIFIVFFQIFIFLSHLCI